MSSKGKRKVQLRQAYVIIRKLNNLIGATDREFLRYYDIVNDNARNEDVNYNDLYQGFQEEVNIAVVGIKNMLHDRESLVRERNTFRTILDDIRSTYPVIFEDRKY